MIATLAQDAVRYRTFLLVGGIVVAVVLLLLLVRPAVRLIRRLPAGTPWFYYLASAGGLAVSLNTSWRFFGERLGVTGTERVVMFSVVELALIACALGMRANVRRVDPGSGRTGAPGAPRTVAWVLCGLSAYAALLLSGPVDGIARVALGPLLSLVMLHLALGIEIRNRTSRRTGTWARIGAEVRERVLSRLGLADDDRDALTRTRERAARRVAQLALTSRSPLRSARLSRALRASNVAHDDRIQRRMLAELAVLKHAGELAELPLPSPWTVPAEPKPTEPVQLTLPVQPAKLRPVSNGVSVPMPVPVNGHKPNGRSTNGRAVNGSHVRANGRGTAVAEQPSGPTDQEGEPERVQPVESVPRTGAVQQEAPRESAPRAEAAPAGQQEPVAQPESPPESVPRQEPRREPARRPQPVPRQEPAPRLEPAPRPEERREAAPERERPRLEQRVERPQPVVRSVREDADVGGVRDDSVLLAEHTSPEWASEATEEAAIDLADELLPERTPGALVAALSQIGVVVAESSVRRRRSERFDTVDHL